MMMPLNDDDAFLSRCLITSSTTTLFPPRVMGVLLLENNDDLGEEKKKIREKTKNDKEIATMKRFRD